MVNEFQELEDYQIEDTLYSQQARENNQRIENAINLFLEDELTIEDLLATLQSFAEEKCMNMLELEEKVRVVIFESLVGPLNSPFMRNTLSTRLHDIVINWYRIRMKSGDDSARKEFFDYKVMIGQSGLKEA